jgi:hypothetical protein
MQGHRLLGLSSISTIALTSLKGYNRLNSLMRPARYMVYLEMLIEEII